MRGILAAAVTGVVAALVGPVAPVSGQDGGAEVPPALLLILDASGSMNADDGAGTPKIQAARDALHGVVDALPTGAPVGLRVYGHRVPNDDKANGCQDTELIVPVQPLDPDPMHGAIDSFPAKGFTPIGLSLQQGAADLPPEGQRTVVLVSDGVDTCAPPDPCAVARDLAASGVDVRIETVGFQVDAAARDQLRCIAEATGGGYRDAPDAASLAEELRTLSQRALRSYERVGDQVRGGPSADEAVPVDPGQYTDDIAVGEERWYGIEAEPGQTIEASATFLGSETGRDSAFAIVKVELRRPDGRFEETDVQSGFGRSARSVAASSGEVDDADGGRWLVGLWIVDDSEVLPAGQRYPLELVLEVTGTPRTTTSAPTTTTTIGGGEIAAADDAPQGDDGGGWGAAELALLAAAFAVVGAVAGWVTASR